MEDNAEIWKPIDELYPYTHFEVSNFGRVRNTKTGNFLSLYQHTPDSYVKFSVRDRSTGFRRTLNLHRVVAIAFVPRPDGCDIVNHIDGDKSNCLPPNLEWTTQRGNLIHAKLTGLNRNYGETHGNAKLTDIQVAEILKLGHLKGVEVARMYNVCPATISMIRNGKLRSCKY